MWENWDTMGDLGHGHGEWVTAQLSHIGIAGPHVGELGHVTMICFNHDYFD